MFAFTKRFEVNSNDVMDVVRLLGRFGLRFEFSDEYWAIDEQNPNHKQLRRRFRVKGTLEQLKNFNLAKDIIMKYNLH